MALSRAADCFNGARHLLVACYSGIGRPKGVRRLCGDLKIARNERSDIAIDQTHDPWAARKEK
ncbi:MAG TPA: hypothetical protein DEB28_05750 [Hyphomonas sp.]|uniref:Uncharacterized protein n=1 Tax=Hyphomonas atlantica TaxID=1280948 RepID=A0A059E0X4_9PROT|nr:hypothetical protein [Hyphomonas atlantica]RAN35729.1 hypothetical protein HY11_13330 [Hyphomonas pacifica]RIJ15264.1 hypothetical protein D1231_10880 [Henriciella mobilis]HBJ41928.1 hypothetical protein [Hyphomonas sp.]KCZ60500.1 hypothetical protein HY36_05845 [Hyphomonas atlantica]RIJ18728.1 hypothetical protein D1227_17230 [Henriciella mobilis]